MSVLDQELDDLFSERVHLEQRVSSLSSLGKDLNSVQHCSKEMASKIHAASISGNEISKQVSQLDCAQTRVESVLSRVTLLLDLKETIKKVEECINDSKYDVAAQETYRILHHDPDSSANIKQIDEVSFEILQDLEHRLISLIKKQCENAQYDHDLKAVIESASLYQYLGDDMKREGLDIYCATITKELRFNLEEQNLTLETQPEGAIIKYVPIIEGYIDLVFTTITDHEHELKRKFSGCQPILKLVEVLHRETDVAVSKLLEHYLKNNELHAMMERINGYNKARHSKVLQNRQSGVRVDGSAEMDILKEMKGVTAIESVDKILDEISHISQELMAYDTTLRSLIAEQDEEEKDGENTGDSAKMKGFEFKLPANSKIMSIRQRLTGDYILLEQFNMQFQIYRVLIEDNNIDSIPSIGGDDGQNQFRSTLSGAIYYLLKTLAVRAFNSYDCNVSCAVVNNICNSLESIYQKWLDSKLRMQPGQRDKTNIAERFYGSAQNLYSGMASNNANSLNHRPTLILLNTIDQSISDTKLIAAQLEEEVTAIFEGVSEKEKFKIRQILKGFDDISKSFERIIIRGMDRYAQTFYPILDGSLDAFKDSNFEMNDKQFNAGKAEAKQGRFVQRLVDSTKPTFFALGRRLNRDNFDRVLIYVLSHYLNELERCVLNQKFTFWGGMQFDQNRQELQSYFTELTDTRSIRDQFTRIRYIAEILQFSKVNEAVNYLNDDITRMGTADQSLTADEIKKFLSLRTEFNSYEIQQLQL